MSDDFGLDDDDDDDVFLEAATQVEASQRQDDNDFAPSPRPRKRRRIRQSQSQLDGVIEDQSEWSVTDSELDSPAECSQTVHSATSATHKQPSNDGPIDDSGYYFPGELGAETAVKTSKYRIHIPKNAVPLEDLYLTQTQFGLDDDPSKFRGAIWKKPPKPPPPPSVCGEPRVGSPGLGLRSTTDPIPGQRAGARQSVLKPVINGSSRNTAGVPMVNAPNGARLGENDQDLAARLQAEEDKLAGNRSRAGMPQQVPKPQQQHTTDISWELADLPSDAFSSSPPQRESSRKEVVTLSSQSLASQAQAAGLRGPQAGLKQMTIFGAPATQGMSGSQAAKKKHAWPLKNRDEPPTHHRLHNESLKTWVFPTNLGTIRDYQYNIICRSLFHNTLVALPTGLGKTFIAATVMLNYYRWTTDAQILFMAPTKPLIAQQMEACYHTVGIPRRDTVLMTGETNPAVRAEEWLEKRIFFMTPQTVINDLKTGICDPKKIVCVVVDEAHKATGSYAYTEVVAFLRRFTSSFRVLALTATPGSTTDAVQAVIDHLGIARVELRTEQSLDIRQYTHEKHTEKELFSYSDEQALIMEHMSKAIQPVLNKLSEQNAYWSRDPMQLSAYGLTNARKKWMGSDAGRKAALPLKGMVNSIFTSLSQLAHGISLLKYHGIGPFYGNAMGFQREVEGAKQKSKYAKQIVEHESWVKMMSYIRGWTNNPDFIGHPKLQYLRDVVLNHFLDAGEGRHGSDVSPAATRIMVFASYRDSTEEICRVLKRNDPMVRPHVFVGQAASKDSEGMNQKKQNEVIQQFKTGKYNTLVATSIGEEGLDIGEVDLIVCYDASASPIRMLQRIGRTGRKRDGRVQLLLMKGKEENDYAKAQHNYNYIQDTIADADRYNYRDDQSPRILPNTAQPVPDKRVIDIPVENSQPIDLNEKGRRGKGRAKQKRPPKKFHMPDNVRTGFVKASRLGSGDDTSEKELASRKKASTKSAQKKQPPPEPLPEPAQLPFLEDVLLNEEQRRDLERKYANAADDGTNPIVTAPDIGRFPDAFREPNKTRYVRHGRTTDTMARALQAIREMDNDKITRWKGVLRMDDLQHDRTTRTRVASPAHASNVSDGDLPTLVAVASKAPKSRARPRKKQAPRRTQSYGSAAAEGDESEPEPTPANMRIATQGIDLGSNDTSGEDEDEEADSELDDFVVRSDQPIEMASSSQSGTQEVARKRKGLRRRMVRTLSLDILSEEEDDTGASGDVDVEEEGGDVIPADARNLKRRKIVDDSDSDE